MPSHRERLAQLHAGVEDECLRRLSALVGRPFTRDDVLHRRGGYDESRRIDSVAGRHLRDLERALRACEAFVAKEDVVVGGFKAAEVAWVTPQIRDLLTRAPTSVVASGEAVVSDRTPGRAVFVRDDLYTFGVARGTDDARTLPPSTLAPCTILAGFWPYTPSAERRWAGDFPTVADVIAREVEHVRQAIKASKKAET